ncbi:zinc finger CCCH domain-containing protein 24 isoform X1 [Coffea eugenioides]|uniref:zinc finger CCCH domain-containing protein 24 isoform X1 n=1 Tax=Coffea eugenioides TaxID=49369 RepID=UPI000F6075F3|nr:zinc finger CCCH domain-containing protein 24 isoform X1 [Coffea eugenioides]
MSAATPTETLNPPVNQQDSSNHVEPIEAPPELTPNTDSDTTAEKRKREDPDPESSPNKGRERENHPFWKTSLCSYFRRSKGSCSHGDTCRYAHGELELRPRPDNTWDPTSERAKKMARIDEGGGTGKEDRNDCMMTEAFADGEEVGGSSEAGLAKCVVNLPMKWTSDNLRNFLDENGISFKSAKKKKGMVVGFVSFESAEQVNSALKELDGKSIGSKNLKIGDVIQRSFDKKNKVAVPNAQEHDQNAVSVNGSSDIDESSIDTENGEPTDECSAPNNSDSKGRTARDVVTPLAHMPYADQLEHKKKSLTQTLKRLTRNARKACPNGVPLPEWVLKSREIGGLPCKLEGIIESPVVNEYRNKCEFSVGYSLQGKLTVGFLLGNFREGVTAVQEPVDCPNVSRIASRYAAIFQEFLTHSSFPIWNRLNNTGFWRQLTVREGRKPGKSAEVENSDMTVSEVMLMVQVCTTGFDDEKVNDELQKMARDFSSRATAESPCLPLTAIVVQDHKGISNAAPAEAPLHSLPIPRECSDSGVVAPYDGVEARIHDYISNLQFSISPTAFFQVNTLAAEKLYALAGEWAGLGPDTLLFDICCGTGTIGLTLAHRVGMVVGIEMNASAVSDAERNADINGIKNCRFICAKAEDVMGSLLKEYLTLSQKQEEILELAEDNKEVKISETTSTESALEPQESSDLENMNCHHESGSLDNGNVEADTQYKSFSSSENGTTSTKQFKNIVAIVDPPRVGLHPTVIKVLRTNTTLRRLVYISCNPESLVANAIELCTPSADKTEKGGQKNNWAWRNMSSAGLARHRAKSMPYSEPFKPVKAMAVDLFPHTPHCELVMLLER